MSSELKSNRRDFLKASAFTFLSCSGLTVLEAFAKTPLRSLPGNTLSQKILGSIANKIGFKGGYHSDLSSTTSWEFGYFPQTFNNLGVEIYEYSEGKSESGLTYYALNEETGLMELTYDYGGIYGVPPILGELTDSDYASFDVSKLEPYLKRFVADNFFHYEMWYSYDWDFPSGYKAIVTEFNLARQNLGGAERWDLMLKAADKLSALEGYYGEEWKAATEGLRNPKFQDDPNFLLRDTKVFAASMDDLKRKIKKGVYNREKLLALFSESNHGRDNPIPAELDILFDS